MLTVRQGIEVLRTKIEMLANKHRCTITVFDPVNQIIEVEGDPAQKDILAMEMDKALSEWENATCEQNESFYQHYCGDCQCH